MNKVAQFVYERYINGPTLVSAKLDLISGKFLDSRDYRLVERVRMVYDSSLDIFYTYPKECGKSDVELRQLVDQYNQAIYAYFVQAQASKAKPFRSAKRAPKNRHSSPKR